MGSFGKYHFHNVPHSGTDGYMTELGASAFSLVFFLEYYGPRAGDSFGGGWRGAALWETIWSRNDPFLHGRRRGRPPDPCPFI